MTDLPASGVDTYSPNSDMYSQVSRLLTQLRTIAHRLPGALDSGTIAERLLDDLRRVAPSETGTVYISAGGKAGTHRVLCHLGNSTSATHAAGETNFDDSPYQNLLTDAWTSQQPQIYNPHSFASKSSSDSNSIVSTGYELNSATKASQPAAALVLPLVAGLRTIGIVLLTHSASDPYSPAVIRNAVVSAAQNALRLEAALLFDEVRNIATNAERQRLAREIHDGVAQELVMIGYALDDVTATLEYGDGPESEGKPSTGTEANQVPEYVLTAARTAGRLREEVTRIITELRLSLFELRSDVDRHGGLGTALADYARTVGNAAGITVHVSLQESGQRLAAKTESELLRIGQEAITNCRKHAKASNLWLVCEVHPPYARIEIHDDGVGIGGSGRKDSYGMSIMRERAQNIRANCLVQPRHESKHSSVEDDHRNGVASTGTSVIVSLS